MSFTEHKPTSHGQFSKLVVYIEIKLPKKICRSICCYHCHFVALTLYNFNSVFKTYYITVISWGCAIPY